MKSNAATIARTAWVVLSIALAAGSGTAPAQTFPAKAVRMIVPFSAGASPDVMTRIVAEELTKDLAQPIIVENRPGSGGNIAADYVAKLPGDGYTVFVGTTANLAVNKTLYRNLPYDPEKDFMPLTVAWITWNVLIVPANSEFKSVADVIAAAHARPGALSYGSPGNGTAGHLVGELFKSVTKTDLTHIPYKGQNQVVSDLIGGHIQLSFETIGSALAMITTGKVRALAITSSARHPKLPAVPTFSESGVREIDDLRGWAMFAVPVSTPAATVARLQESLSRALSTASVRQRLEDLGVEVVITSPAASQNMISREVVRWGKLVTATGARAE